MGDAEPTPSPTAGVATATSIASIGSSGSAGSGGAASTAPLHVNVGGLRERVARGSARRFPHSRLGKLARCESHEQALRLCDDYCDAADEFYFDRNPAAFRGVLNLYRTGRLHLIEELCVFSFSQELEYWGVQDYYMGSCCSYKYHERKENCGDSGEFDEDDDDEEGFTHDDDDDGGSGDSDDGGSGGARGERAPPKGSPEEEMASVERDMEEFTRKCCGQRRRLLWLTLENPDFSAFARVIAAVSVLAVLTSVAAMCVNSMPEFQAAARRRGAAGATAAEELEEERGVLAQVERMCIAWFTAELVLRLAAAPRLGRFVREPLNVIDAVSVLPYYATEAVRALLSSGVRMRDVGRVTQSLRLLRVFRILKLARHSAGLRSLGETLAHSHSDIGVLLLFLATGILIFASLAYYLERDDGENMGTIPLCYWWATISMTTVGYGDAVPTTPAGKAVSVCCVLCGILIMSMPVTIIFNKFIKYYRRQKAREVTLRRRLARNALPRELFESHRDDDDDDDLDRDRDLGDGRTGKARRVVVGLVSASALGVGLGVGADPGLCVGPRESFASGSRGRRGRRRPCRAWAALAERLLPSSSGTGGGGRRQSGGTPGGTPASPAHGRGDLELRPLEAAVGLAQVRDIGPGRKVYQPVE
ncbi:delayed-rectifier potassium channel regulatory subunit KCNS3-like [Petromyzon marinus]|uniref:Potassium voltage-gated channel subfamily S member 3-like n=1 Tax=Petromyzon marinus TaxID=7757 RepID=A0AAJ7XIL4_PETMA|nr:potassium voltage-gated channel subfamily S member 3-like [Petromyzon marinus]